MEAFPRKLKNYRTQEGHEPFQIWLSEFKDVKAKVRIIKRLEQAEQGNLGDCSREGEGVLAFVIDIGPGYRVYVGLDGRELVVLLCGGEKYGQERDITLARKYWADYKSCK